MENEYTVPFFPPCANWEVQQAISRIRYANLKWEGTLGVSLSLIFNKPILTPTPIPERRSWFQSIVKWLYDE